MHIFKSIIISLNVEKETSGGINYILSHSTHIPSKNHPGRILFVGLLFFFLRKHVGEYINLVNWNKISFQEFD